MSTPRQRTDRHVGGLCCPCETCARYEAEAKEHKRAAALRAAEQRVIEAAIALLDSPGCRWTSGLAADDRWRGPGNDLADAVDALRALRPPPTPTNATGGTR